MSFLADMTLQQAQIDVVFQALEDWCRKIDRPIDSNDGRDVAVVMLGLYKTGHTTQASLIEAMRKIDPN